MNIKIKTKPKNNKIRIEIKIKVKIKILEVENKNPQSILCCGSFLFVIVYNVSCKKKMMKITFH